MNLIAIDPGPKESAYIVLTDGKSNSFGKVANTSLAQSLVESTADRIVIEMIASYGMPVGAEVFETCVWIGRFMEAFGAEHCDRITRNEVKNHLCHSSRAKDSNIRQALIDRLGPPGTKKAPGPTFGLAGDTWAALAVGLTWLDTRGAAAAG